MIEEFRIPELNEKELFDKLSNIRYPQEFENSNEVGWRLGTPSWAVKELVESWKNNFSWESRREEINQWHHYKTNINDLNVHFIHETSNDDKAIPIILIHGWPSTFYEFHKIINPLRDGHKNGAQSFHVVVPSLPGYGFSEQPKADGCDAEEVADILHKLMLNLGYNKYIVYGTDWGSAIGKLVVQNYSNHVLGYLTNMPFDPPPLPTLRNLINYPLSVLMFLIALIIGYHRVYPKDEITRLNVSTFANVDKDESAGYRAIQATRPYTLSFGLSDSPVGLLSWMLDGYHSWGYFPSKEAGHTGILPVGMTTDEFLTQVTIYWITNTMSSSIRLYYEAKRTNPEKLRKRSSTYTSVPIAISSFESETLKFPKDWTRVSNNLVQYEKHKTGGHFPALEATDLLLGDIQKFSKLL